MKLFQNHKNMLSNLKEVSFKLEREIQHIFEQNLEKITGLEFVKSEFIIQNQRIDTLAFDTESQSFVIIEYKRSHNYSVFDQGVSYLNTLLKFKADFVLEYNEILNKKLKRDDVDWSQSKVVFVSPAFNQFQKQAVDFNDLNIELWEIKQFENNIIAIDGVKKSDSSPSIKTSVKKENSNLDEITKELKTYTEADHLQGKSDEILELYNDFKNAILNLSSEMKVEIKQRYIAFKIDKKNISDIEVQKSGLKIYINLKKGQLDDSKKIMRDVSKIGCFGNGDYQIIVKDTQYLEYIMSLVKQAL